MELVGLPCKLLLCLLQVCYSYFTDKCQLCRLPSPPADICEKEDREETAERIVAAMAKVLYECILKNIQ